MNGESRGTQKEWQDSFLSFDAQMQISLRSVVCNHYRSRYHFAHQIPNLNLRWSMTVLALRAIKEFS